MKRNKRVVSLLLMIMMIMITALPITTFAEPPDLTFDLSPSATTINHTKAVSIVNVVNEENLFVSFVGTTSGINIGDLDSSWSTHAFDPYTSDVPDNCIIGWRVFIYEFNSDEGVVNYGSTIIKNTDLLAPTAGTTAIAGGENKVTVSNYATVTDCKLYLIPSSLYPTGGGAITLSNSNIKEITGNGDITGLSAGQFNIYTVYTSGLDPSSNRHGAYVAGTAVTVTNPSATVPDAPTIGTATAGDGQASVSFTAPSNNGGAAITGYTVTSSPDGKIGTGTGSPITVTGLTNGTAYTFTVVATNSVGTSAPSDASNSVTPTASTTPTPTYTLTVKNGHISSDPPYITSGDYEEGEDVDIIANDPPYGKVFDKWTSSNGGVFEVSTASSTQFRMPGNNVTVTANYMDDPIIIKNFGSWTGKGTAKAIVDLEREHFIELLKDGKTVSPSNYELESGSTIITFSEAFLNTLPNGSHQFVAVFSMPDRDDYYANLMLLVNKGSSQEDVVTVTNIKSGVKTGDSTNLIGWIAALTLSATGVVLVPFTKRRRSK